MSSPSAGDRTACANHPYIGAAFICGRCGAFGCEACRSVSLSDFCQTCGLRFRSPVSGLRQEDLSAWALLRDSFRLWVRNKTGIGLFLGILVLGRLPFLLIQWFLSERGVQAGFLVRAAPVGIRIFAVSVFMCWTAEELHQERGRSVSRALRAGLRRFFPLCLSFLLLALISGLGLFVGFQWGAGPFFFLLELFFVACLVLAPTAVVVSGYGPLAALHRAFVLSRSYFWRLLGVFGLLLALLAVALVVWSQWLEPALEAVAPKAHWLLGFLLWSGLDALFLSLLLGCGVLTWLRLCAHAGEPGGGDDAALPPAR